MNIVEIKGLKKSFQSGEDTLEILNGIDFDLPESALMSLTGESGSGKSTFLNIVGALDKADDGEVFSCGVPLHQGDETSLSHYRNRNTGFIFQFHYLLKDFTALENIMLPGRIMGQPESKIKEKALELLHDVQLSSRAGHYPGQLSGGERQRIALARALINSPSLILADEPTGSLDEKNSRLVEDLLFQLVEDTGVSLILVTHDRELARRAPLQYDLHSGRLNPI